MPVSTKPAKLLYSREEAAELLSVSVRGVDAWIRDGLISTVKLGRLVRINQAEIDRIVANGIDATPRSIEA